MPEVAFSVFIPTGRNAFYVEWTVPRKKTRIRRSTGKTKERDAQRVAKQIIDEWFANRGREGDAAWSEFVSAHEDEVQPSLAKETRRMYGIVFNAVEKHISPAVMSDMTARAVSRLQAKWRGNKLSEHSIGTYLAHLSKALKWAKSQGMIPETPAIERPQLARKERKAKGRPISGEEFDRMIATVPLVIKANEAVPSWERALRGLWLSSLRLSELLTLSWDDRKMMRVDLDGSFPALLIPSAVEKGRKDRIVPIMADFAEFLQATPTDQRRGRVFPLVQQRDRKGKRPPDNMQYVSKMISKIGEEAGIIVGHYTASGKTKYASAHDLRRSFGRRWAGKVQNSIDLKTLMRHESLETTMAYYAHEDAEGLAKRVAELAISFAITTEPADKIQNTETQSPVKTSAKLPG